MGDPCTYQYPSILKDILFDTNNDLLALQCMAASCSSSNNKANGKLEEGEVGVPNSFGNSESEDEMLLEFSSSRAEHKETNVSYSVCSDMCMPA